MPGFNFNIGGFNFGSGGGAAAGTAAKKGCGGGCGAVFGVILGIIMVPVGFYLVYHAEVKLVDHGKVFEGITMSEPDAAKGMDGELVKIQGQAEGSFLRIPEWDGQALYTRTLVEEYEEETDSEGDVTREWNTESSESQWVQSFSVGGVEIRPSGANPVGEDEVYSAYKKKFETAFHVGTSSGSPDVGDQRKSIDVLDATKSVIIVGQMSGGSIQGGYSFVVSTQNEQQTLQTLKTEYKMAKWGMRAGAVFLIFFGIMAIFGPLTTLVGYIPLVGDSIGCAFAAAAFAFALVSVTIVTVFIKAFWILVAIVVIGVGYMIIRGVTSPKSKPGSGDGTPGDGPQAPPVTPTAAPMAVPTPGAPPQPSAQPAPPAAQPAPTPEPAPPVAEPEPPAQAFSGSDFMRPAEPAEQAPEADDAPKFCAKCGAGLDPDSRFCRECGEKVG